MPTYFCLAPNTASVTSCPSGFKFTPTIYVPACQCLPKPEKNLLGQSTLHLNSIASMRNPLIWKVPNEMHGTAMKIGPSQFFFLAHNYVLPFCIFLWYKMLCLPHKKGNKRFKTSGILPKRGTFTGYYFQTHLQIIGIQVLHTHIQKKITTLLQSYMPLILLGFHHLCHRKICVPRFRFSSSLSPIPYLAV